MPVFRKVFFVRLSRVGQRVCAGSTGLTGPCSAAGQNNFTFVKY